MKIEIEIDNDYLYSSLINAHCRYWASDLVLRSNTLAGYVVESESDDNGKPKKHKINGITIAIGIANLAKHVPFIFGRLIGKDLDGPQADVVLQFCAGVVWEHDGKIDPKYG